MSFAAVKNARYHQETLSDPYEEEGLFAFDEDIDEGVDRESRYYGDSFSVSGPKKQKKKKKANKSSGSQVACSVSPTVSGCIGQSVSPASPPMMSTSLKRTESPLEEQTKPVIVTVEEFRSL
eukprot:TRINITY_DN6743_c0_g1_i1.p1 TRINITY_DN6743_c0_g1~~TRINITY_DN6743_c0_g1_i1.p1  ORF type:complete len:122 (-),score=10.28 TRINITY_DN6743_c0_g1_i1:96-461(-)